jgi:fructokinase
MNPLPTVVGLGEMLWDLLPSGRQLGGAPANFAYWSHVLGSRAAVASRVADDELGAEARRLLLSRGITDQFVQSDPAHPTGTARVQLDSAGQPQFEIVDQVAWDFLEWSDPWKALAQSADAVCFGSLAQRSAESRETTHRFLDHTRGDAFRIFDVNLRRPFYSAEIIAQSAQRANIVKLNHEELPMLAALLGIEAEGSFSFCSRMVERFALRLICVTRGANGSLLSDGTHTHEHPGFRVAVQDTVGSGDAFTAALIHSSLAGCSLARCGSLSMRRAAKQSRARQLIFDEA